MPELTGFRKPGAAVVVRRGTHSAGILALGSAGETPAGQPPGRRRYKYCGHCAFVAATSWGTTLRSGACDALRRN